MIRELAAASGFALNSLITDDRQYQLVITAPSEWMTLYIPFKLLRPAGEGQQISWETARTQIENLIIPPVERPAAFQLLIDDVLPAHPFDPSAAAVMPRMPPARSARRAACPTPAASRD